MQNNCCWCQPEPSYKLSNIQPNCKMTCTSTCPKPNCNVIERMYGGVSGYFAPGKPTSGFQSNVNAQISQIKNFLYSKHNQGCNIQSIYQNLRMSYLFRSNSSIWTGLNELADLTALYNAVRSNCGY